MAESDYKNPISIQSSTQFEEVQHPKPNSPLILRSSAGDAYEDLNLTFENKSMLRASGDVNCNGNRSSSSLDSEVINTDVKKIERTKEIMGTENDVEDMERKKENGELKDSDALLEIDHVDKSDNVVLRKLLRGPRYFDSQDSNWGKCYNCGEAGHTVTNCTAAKRKKPCFVCGSLEHNPKQCKQGKVCFICKKGGHRAKNCPEKSMEGFQKAKLCLKCGDSGHEMFICKNGYSPEDLKEVQCYICKCFGHLCCVDYGKSQSEVSCYRCGQLDHTGLECASSSARAHVETTNTTSPSFCYKCGEEGHKARKCKTSTKKRKRKKNPKHKKSNDNVDHVGVKSAPHDVGVRSAPRDVGVWSTPHDVGVRPAPHDVGVRPAPHDVGVRPAPHDVGVRPSPHDVGKAHKRHKTRHGYSTPSQPRRRGGWINEDHGGYYNGTQWRSPLTPPRYSYRSNDSFHGNHGYGGYDGYGGHGGYGSGFQYEASSSNGYDHGYERRFSGSRFGNSSSYGRREYGWWDY